MHNQTFEKIGLEFDSMEIHAKLQKYYATENYAQLKGMVRKDVLNGNIKVFLKKHNLNLREFVESIDFIFDHFLTPKIVECFKQMVVDSK